MLLKLGRAVSFVLLSTLQVLYHSVVALILYFKHMLDLESNDAEVNDVSERHLVD